MGGDLLCMLSWKSALECTRKSLQLTVSFPQPFLNKQENVLGIGFFSYALFKNSICFLQFSMLQIAIPYPVH